MSIVEAVKDWAQGVVSAMGYPGIAVLTGLGLACLPIPSEVVLPFAGILAAQGKLNLHVIAWSAAVGSVFGSLLGYSFGRLLGREFLLKFGKYLLLKPSEIRHAEEWFERFGLGVTFWGPFVPLVRAFISVPAGMYRSNIPLFMLYSFLAAIPWCYFWTYLGYKLGQHWSEFEAHMKTVDVVVIVVVSLLAIKFIWSRFKKEPEPALASEAAPANVE